MKKALAFLIIAAILLACTPLGMAADTTERNHYDMDFEIDMDNKVLSGQFDVTAYNDSQDAWDELCLRDYATTLLEMAGDAPTEFISINDENGAALNYYRDADDASIVYVELNEALPPGESAKISIEYSAGIPRIAEGTRYGWRPIPTDESQLIFELANFYPVMAIYEDGGWVAEPYFDAGECFYSSCADYDLKVSVSSSSYTIISTGDESVAYTEAGPAIWTISASNVRDVAMTAYGNHGGVNGRTASGVAVGSYYYEGDDTHDTERQAEVSYEATETAMEYFEEIVGPYPYDSIDVAMSALEGFGGMEYPMCVRIADYSTRGAAGDKAVTRICAHEAAHQWFYAVVGNNQYKEAWLDEGFATLLETLYLFHIGRDDWAEERLAYARERVETTPGLDKAYINLSYEELGDLYGGAVYSKAGLFLYDLMQEMGEDVFFDMLKDYYGEYSFKEAATEDFIAKVYEYDDSDGVCELVDANIKS